MKQVEVVIAGSGPAGVLLATECGRLGMSVVCVAPSPTERWDRCFGIWANEVPDDLSHCVETSWAAPIVRTWSRGERLLGHRYMKLDTPKLQDELLERARSFGVEFVQGLANGVEHNTDGSVVSVDEGESITARFFVDATGGSRTLMPAGPDHP